MTNKTLANRLLDQGFDGTWISKGVVHVRCGQCESLVICGIATHEHGCPNARHECKGCNEQVPVNQRKRLKSWQGKSSEEINSKPC